MAVKDIFPGLLSVVIPAYNEERRIGKTIKKIIRYLGNKKTSYELIIVDDGSKDATVNVINKFRSKRIKVLRNNSNRGKGYSVKRGILYSKGDYSLFTDADLSTPIEELEKLSGYLPKYDIVIGSRKAEESKIVESQPFWRVFAGNMFPLVVKILMGMNIKDTQCGFKLFNMKTCRKIFEKQGINGFGFDVELLYLAKKHNLKIKDVGVKWYNDSETKVKFIRHSASMFFELVKIKFNGLRGRYD